MTFGHHPLHGAGGHQANSRAQPGKGVPTETDSNGSNQRQAPAIGDSE
jgi:hypothetical protein